MMSQKSLKNNIKGYDFRSSFLSGCIYPAVALCVLFLYFAFPVIGYVTEESFKTTLVHSEVSMFVAQTAEYFFPLTFIYAGMVCCGMLTAVHQFGILMSKKKVNVYLSMGISRTRLYFNRIAASAAAIFIAVLIPLGVTYIVNIASFGMSAHITKVFLYAVASLTVSGLIGLAVGAASSAVSGSVPEAVVTSVSLSFLSMIFFNIVTVFKTSFLTGYSYFSSSASFTGANNWKAVVSPWTFVCNFNSEVDAEAMDVTAASLFRTLTREGSAETFKVPKELAVDAGFVLPVLVWFVLSVLLIAAGWLLLKKRKAENSNSFGKFTVSRTVYCLAIMGAAVIIAGNILSSSQRQTAGRTALAFVIMTVAALAVFLFVQFVSARKFKTVLRSLPLFGAMLLFMACLTVFFSTDCFGTYNKAPEKEDIKSVAVDVWGHPYLNYLSGTAYNPIMSSESKDFDTVASVMNILKDEKGDSDSPNTTVNLIIELKDGSKKIREYKIYSKEVLREYMKTVYNSDYFDKVLKTVLYNSDVSSGYYGNGIYADSVVSDSLWHIVDPSLLYAAGESAYAFATEGIEDSKLTDCLYEDLSKMTFEELFENNSRPVAVLSNSCVGFADAGEMLTVTGYYTEQPIEEVNPTAYIASFEIPVYPQMKATVAYIETAGLEKEPSYEGSVKEILYTDSPLSLTGAINAFAEKNQDNYDGGIDYIYWLWEDNSVFSASSSQLISMDGVGMFTGSDISKYDMLIKVYNEVQHPLKKLSAAEGKNVLEASVPMYFTAGDNGRYIYVIYEDGTMMNYYLPEANLASLKLS